MRVILFFFFSSRRRHTRLQGDWSSDVCSSDLRRKYVRDGREYFAREGAILVLAVLGDVIRVAAHSVFPVRPGVSLVGLKVLAVALFDVFEEILERCVMQLRVSVFTVPGLDQRGGAGNEVSVLRLRAVNLRRIGFVLGLGVRLQEH